VKSALVLPMSLGLLAAACGNPSVSEAARTDATRLVSSASRNLSVDTVIRLGHEVADLVLDRLLTPRGDEGIPLNDADDQ